MEFHSYKGAYDMFHICTVFHQMVLLDDTTLKLEFKKSNSALIQVSTAQCAKETGALLYLLKKILKLVTTFFLFLTDFFLCPGFSKYLHFLYASCTLGFS